MKKKIIGMIIIILVIVVLSIVISVVSGSKKTKSMVIQDQSFKAAEGFTNMDVNLVLTNDKNNFYINDKLVPEAIRVKPKTTLNVKVVNNSDYETSIHFHGVNGDSNMDGVGGVTQDNIKPGGEFTYSFNLDEPGTYMYHSHVDSASQVNNENLYGGLVVEEETQTNSDMLMFNTNIDNVDEHHAANQTFDQVLVNGKNKDSLNIDSDENIYLNIVNISSAPLSINFGKDIKYRINSIDANPATSSWVTNQSIIVPTAQRLIVEIENPKHSFQISTSLKSDENAKYNVYYKGDKDIEEQDFSGEVANRSMMENTEFSNLADDAVLVYDLVETKDDLDVDGKRVDVKTSMTLDMNSGSWVINDKAFPDTTSIDVKEGDVVEVTLTNTSHMAETHPFHLHGHKFQVMEVNGEKVDKNLVLDTIDVEPGNEVTIRFNADNPGIWAFHCHNLVHAGSGMMTTVNYEGYSTNVGDEVTE